jgi:hypothetical protein
METRGLAGHEIYCETEPLVHAKRTKGEKLEDCNCAEQTVKSKICFWILPSSCDSEKGRTMRAENKKTKRCTMRGNHTHANRSISHYNRELLSLVLLRALCVFFYLDLIFTSLSRDPSFFFTQNSNSCPRLFLARKYYLLLI